MEDEDRAGDERIPAEDGSSTRRILAETNAIFRRHFAVVAAPVLMAAFLEYWLNGLSIRAGHWLMVETWSHLKGNPQFLSVAVVPISFVEKMVMWLVQMLLWGLAFTAIAAIVSSLREHPIGPVSAGRAMADQRGLPSLFGRLYVRLALSLYAAMIGSGAAGWMLYSLHLHWPFGLSWQAAAMGIGLLVVNPLYLLYAHRFALALPLLVTKRAADADPLRLSIQVVRLRRRPVFLGCFLALTLSGMGDRYLPGWIFSLSAEQISGMAREGIALLVFCATGLLWGWLFVFLTTIVLTPGKDGAAQPEPAGVPQAAL